ncbi:hypothetical protein WMY93_000231 [Mugilogobius chulae]|uniref:DRBM domain-containing protein n=1 Tax=Mugilogobius chulae TaxID=88201 RepID=A0AAW0Q0A6_9GOBI
MDQPSFSLSFKEGLQPCDCLLAGVLAYNMPCPKYELLDSKCVPWGFLYTISVSVYNTTVIGTGPTETAAKNNAAAEMLKLMGLKCPKYNALMDNKHQIQQDIWESPDVIIEDIYEEFDDEHQELQEEDARSELNRADEVSQTSEANLLSDLAPSKVLLEKVMAPKSDPEATIQQDQEVSDEKNTITDQLEDHEDVSVLLITNEVRIVPSPDEPPVLDSNADKFPPTNEVMRRIVPSPDEPPVLDSNADIFPNTNEVRIVPSPDEPPVLDSNADVFPPTNEVMRRIVPSPDEPPVLDSNADVFPPTNEVMRRIVPSPDEPPVLDSNADVFPQSADVTPQPSGQELTPEEDHVCEPPETEKSPPDSTTEDPYAPNKLMGPEPSDILPEVLHTETGSDEQSLCKTQCERHHTSDLFTLPEVVHTIGTGSVEQSLCETHPDMNSHTAEMSEGSYPTIQESEGSLLPLDKCQEKPTSPQIQDEPSLAYFLVQALVQKLIQKQHINQEDQAETVSVLLKNTTEHISNQDVQMSMKDMKYVARGAAKDL